MSSRRARLLAAGVLSLALVANLVASAAQVKTSPPDTSLGISIQTRSVSAQLDVHAEPVGPNLSAYRVVLKNRSQVALVWAAVRAYRGDRLAMSGLPRGKRNVPLVLPNTEYVTVLTASTGARIGAEGPETWQPVDRIEIPALMWQDGLVEGDRDIAERERRFDEGRADSLRRLLDLLSGATHLPLPALRSTLTPAMGFDAETRQAREDLLADVDALERTHRSQRGEAFDAWLARTRAEHQQWLARIVLPKSS